MRTQDNIPSWILGKSFVSFDMETTGLSPEDSKIIEIGAVKIENGNITKKFRSLINPHCEIPKEITKLTRIRNRDVVKAPDFNEVIAEFHKFCADSALIGHNMDYELKFLRYYTKDSIYVFPDEIYDTLTLAKQYFALPENKDRKPPNYKLITLAAHMKLGRKSINVVDASIVQSKLFLKIMSNEHFKI